MLICDPYILFGEEFARCHKLVYFIFSQLSFKISSYISDMSPFLKSDF